MNRNGSNKKKPILVFTIYKIVIIGIAFILVLNFLVENSSSFYRKSISLPFSLHLNKQDVYMIKGEEFKLSVFAINKRVSYSSTNFRVAGVNFNGRVYAYRTGKAFIIVKVGEKQLKCRIHVIDINKDNIVLKVGDTNRLKVKGSNTYVHWKSNDTNVVSVNIFGKLKGKKQGRTEVYAKVKGKVLKCTVKVE